MIYSIVVALVIFFVIIPSIWEIVGIVAAWLIKLVAEVPSAPWNQPEYDDLLRIEPHKDGFIYVNEAEQRGGQLVSKKEKTTHGKN